MEEEKNQLLQRADEEKDDDYKICKSKINKTRLNAFN